MNKNRKRVLSVIGFIIFIILLFGTVDYFRVKAFNKPIFSIGINLEKNNESGTYVGLGYAFKIKGNFKPSDELQGVTSYEYFILGIKVSSGIRD